MLLARSRVDGSSDTMVYTTGLMEKLAVALRSRTSVPAAQDSAVLGCVGIPRKPIMLGVEVSFFAFLFSLVMLRRCLRLWSWRAWIEGV